jgi:hypothetical protein
MLIGGVEFNDVELKALGKFTAAQIATKNDPASTTPTSGPLHGPFPGSSDTQFGAFSSPGVRPQMFSALYRPRSFMRLLQMNASEYWQEKLEIMTGVTAGSGSNATGFCGNPPQAGQAKVMKINYQFGDWYMKTNLNVVPKVGLLKNRADVPREILNAGPSSNPLIPDIMYNLTNTRDQLAYELFLLGVEMERSMEVVSILGNSSTSSSNTQRGWIKEYTGLDSLIKTGYTDADTSIAAPAADSIVVSFNALITSTAAGGDGRNIEQVLSDVMYALNDRASAVGMEGVEWGFVMRKEQFRALTDVLSYQYSVHRAAVVSSDTINLELTDANSLRLAMLNGRYLLIEGVQYPVVFSEGIPNQAISNNTYNADMYIVPLSWAGRPLIRYEYFAMDNPMATKFASFVNAADSTVINNGLYFVSKRSTGNCIEYHFSSSGRLILETPFLAARVDDVQYAYRAATHESIPGTSLYANGGVTYRGL